MKAEVVLIPDESKKLIIKALLALEAVKHVIRNGLLIVHPSSTTAFIYEFLTGHFPEGDEQWVAGMVLPRGLCVSRHVIEVMVANAHKKKDPLDIKSAWVFKNGALQEKMRLGDILDQMTADDIYVKGPNAIDPEGNMGVLYANPAGGGGTIGQVLSRAKQTKFQILFPAGIEKMIPVPIAHAVKKAGFKSVDRAMGLPCGVIPIPASAGRKIDEMDAVKILSGAEATPIAAGGLAGASGAVVLAIDGTGEQVDRAMAAVESVKGTRLPKPNLLQCEHCPNPNCHQRGIKDVDWLKS